MLLDLNNVLTTRSDAEYIFLTVNRKRRKVIYADIRFVESDREYIKIFTVSETFLIKGAISFFCQILPEKKFIRIHRRYIVSSNFIKAFDAKYIYGDDFKLPIGRTYKQQIANQL